MNHHETWNKLVTVAQRAPEGDVAAPLGFSTRVAAQGLARFAARPDWFGMLAFRALLVAVTVMIGTAALSYSWPTSTDTETDPAAELVAEL